MADTAASSPQASLPDSPSRSPSPYPYARDDSAAPGTFPAASPAPHRSISDRSMTDETAAEAGPSTLPTAPPYREPPASPSNTSQSDDAQDFADLASSSFNLDDKGAVAHQSRLLKDVSAVRLSRRGTLVPASVSSPPSTAGSLMGEEVASASNLPHEILVHIFKYVAGFPPDLLACLQVSKAWCICGVELLWHRPSFYKISSLFKLIAVIRKTDQLFPYADFVRRLNFTILASQLEDKLFVRMNACTRLERLTLAGCCHILDDTLINVFQNTKQLVALDLTDVVNLTDATLRTLAENCLRLQGINLTGCKKITTEGVVELAKSCKLLRRVKLCGCENVGDEALIALADHCPVLLEVDMINCPNITDKSVREIWKKSFHMRELRLAHCGDLTDDAFPSARGIKGVAMLGTSQNLALRTGIGSSGYQPGESAGGSRGSSPARFAGVENGAEPDSSRSAGLTPPIASQRLFDHLRILDLTSCNSITDDTVEGIVANVPRIKNLILAKCTRLTDESVYSISKLGKNLHYLHLGHVSNITDRAVTHLARSCTRLRYIDLACCPHLTDLSVFELAANLPKLRRIGLVKVVNLTDQAIYSLVDRHTSLERIHLSYCENISVPAIFWLLQRLNRLTHLSLTGVPAFRRQELQAMCRPPPKDFNEHQRQAFCVFSGKGVNELRRYLQKVYSDEQLAAQFGPLAPDVQRAIAAMAEEDGGFATQHGRHATSMLHRTRAASDVPNRSMGLDPQAVSNLAIVGPTATGAAALSTADQLYYQQQLQMARYANARRAAMPDYHAFAQAHPHMPAPHQHQHPQMHSQTQAQVEVRRENGQAARPLTEEQLLAERAARRQLAARLQAQTLADMRARAAFHPNGGGAQQSPWGTDENAHVGFPQTQSLAGVAPSTELVDEDNVTWARASSMSMRD
ncbi:SCF ubiquitin ligase complex subunit [Thecaphora frezii]